MQLSSLPISGYFCIISAPTVNSVCLSRKISNQKEEKEGKIKIKIESIKNMIYVENVNWKMEYIIAI